jgi:hypothetical protein
MCGQRDSGRTFETTTWVLSNLITQALSLLPLFHFFHFFHFFHL